MQHPLSMLVEGIVAAAHQLVGDLHQQALGVLRLHVCRHRPQNHGVAAEVRNFKACIFQKRNIIQQSLFFLGGKIDGGRLQQHLAGHIAVVRRQLFVQLALVGCVLVDQAQLVPALGKDIGAEHLAHIMQRFRLTGRGVEVQLLRFGRFFRFCSFRNRCLRFVRYGLFGNFRLQRSRVPRRHSVRVRMNFCFFRLRFHIQLRFAGRRAEGLRRFLLRRFRAVQGHKRIQHIVVCRTAAPAGNGRLHRLFRFCSRNRLWGGLLFRFCRLPACFRQRAGIRLT